MIERRIATYAPMGRLGNYTYIAEACLRLSSTEENTDTACVDF